MEHLKQNLAISLIWNCIIFFSSFTMYTLSYVTKNNNFTYLYFLKRMLNINRKRNERSTFFFTWVKLLHPLLAAQLPSSFSFAGDLNPLPLVTTAFSIGHPSFYIGKNSLKPFKRIKFIYCRLVFELLTSITY